MDADQIAADIWAAFRRAGPLAPDWNTPGLNPTASLFACPVLQQ